MNIFELNDLNIVNVDEVIGCYDDVRNKELNTFGKKKKFKKFKMILHVLPKNIEWIKCEIPNYDVFSLYEKAKKTVKGTCWDIKQTKENGNIVFYILDKTPMAIKDVYIELDDYYTYYEGAKIIKNLIDPKNEKSVKFSVEYYKEPMYKQLQSFLGRKFDDHILWQET